MVAGYPTRWSPWGAAEWLGSEAPRLATLLKRSRAGHQRLLPSTLRRGKSLCPSSGWPLQSFKKSGPGTRARGQEPDGGSTPRLPARHVRQDGADRPALLPTLAGTRSTTTRWTTACCCRNSEDKRLPPVLPATPDGRRATRTTPGSEPTSAADGCSRASAARTSRRRRHPLLSIPSRLQARGPTSIHGPELDHCERLSRQRGLAGYPLPSPRPPTAGARLGLPPSRSRLPLPTAAAWLARRALTDDASLLSSFHPCPLARGSTATHGPELIRREQLPRQRSQPAPPPPLHVSSPAHATSTADTEGRKEAAGDGPGRGRAPSRGSETRHRVHGATPPTFSTASLLV